MSERNLAAVIAMFEGWKSLNADEITKDFAEDIVFREAPNDHVLHGKAAVRHQVEDSLARFVGYDYSLTSSAASGDLVFVERDEFVTVPGGRVAEVPVLGVFEFDGDGRIAAWRDYWDKAPFARPPAATEPS